MKRFLLPLLLLILAAPATAQMRRLPAVVMEMMRRAGTVDTLRFSSTPAPVWASPGTYWYRIPPDSVAALVYGSRAIEPTEAWLRAPAFVVKRNASEDSAFGTERIAPGSYLGIGIREGTVYLDVRRKPAFTHEFVDLRDLRLLIVRDTAGESISSASVVLGHKSLAYDAALGGYPLPARKGADTLYIRKGDDVDLLTYTYTPKDPDRPNYRAAERPDWNSQNFEGYLVTNKPVYTPGDTVRYKAYLLDPHTRKPATTAVQVSFLLDYSKKIVVHSRLRPTAPGVYFSEFVVGDSIRVEQVYDLRMEQTSDRIIGSRAGSTLTVDQVVHAQRENVWGKVTTFITQRFKVEDYLLENSFLSVKGESEPSFLHGDSVLLWAHAFDASRLPLTDGTLSLTVTPVGTSFATDTPYFIPDTLYHIRGVPVSATGETPLHFSSAAFPRVPMQWRCAVRLQSSGGEVRDTAFILATREEPFYIRSRVEEDRIIAELVRGKKMVDGRGTLTITDAAGLARTESIRFPYSGPLTGRMVRAVFQKDTVGGIAQPDVAVLTGTDAVALTPSYDRDTAFLHIQNPRGATLRYVWYRSAAFGGSGKTESRDTTLRFQTTAGETITVLSEHQWAGLHTLRTPIYKWDRKLNIDVNKKAAVYPGATDSVDISLTDADGRPVPQTNVTVLAFNGQFAEDFTPALEYRGVLRPSAPAPRFAVSLQPQLKNGVARRITLFDRRWLRLCGLDTAWHYARLHSGASGAVIVRYPAPAEPRARLAIFLQQAYATSYQQPVAVWVDDVPVYYAFAHGPVVESIPVPAGRHRVRARFANTEMVLRDEVDIQPHTANVIFLSERKLFLRAYRTAKNAALDTRERTEAVKHVQAYELEPRRYSGPAWVGQGPLTAALSPYGAQLVGPIDPARGLIFYQEGNTRMEHWAESGQVLTFREGMTRVRNESGTMLQNQSLTSAMRWDVFAEAFAPGIRLDTVRFRKPPRVVRKEGRAQPADVTPYFLETPPPDSLAVHRARLQLQNKTGTGIKAVVVQSVDESERYIRTAERAGNWALRPGRYRVQVFLANEQVVAMGPIQLRANGVTTLPVTLKQAMPTVYEDQPEWVQEALVWPAVVEDMTRYDSVRSSRWPAQAATYSPGSGIGEIYGTVVDENNEPVINALVAVTNGGITIGSVVTDFDGNYSVKPLAAGMYTVTVTYLGYKTDVVEGAIVPADEAARVNYKLERFFPSPSNPTAARPTGRRLDEVMVRARRYERPLIEARSPGSRTVFTASELERMPTRSPLDAASTAPGVYQSSSLNVGGGRSGSTLYVVDGIVQVGSRGISNLPFSVSGDVNSNALAARYGDASGGVNGSSDDASPFLQSGAGQEFISAFLGGMNGASGIRRHFRDWAIWEPNLWTGNDGKTSFVAHYPDNITAWKTYVLAMNERGFSGRQFSVTRAFKPLSAQLMVPRFLRYGDTLQAVTKVMNYTGQPFTVRTHFRQERRPTLEDSITVNNARTASFIVPAPATTSADTGRVPLAYTLTAPNGFQDGEEREMPVYPTGVSEFRSTLVKVMRDTTFETAPAGDDFSGLTRFAVDESQLGLMLREIERLKEYPYGCTEQLTTRLLAISYEEEVKRTMGATGDFNNKAVRKEIIRKLAKAQNPDGSFGWFGGNGVDYRITNYVLSTMERIGDKTEIRSILQQGYAFLARGLFSMTPTEQLTALSTLSAGKYPTAYPEIVRRLSDTLRDDWSRFAIARICQEQRLRCDSLLDTLAAHARYDRLAGYGWSRDYYDWYRNRTATTILAYRVFAASPRHDTLASAILDHLLFNRRSTAERSTAERGQLLSAVIPNLLASGALKKGASRMKSTVRISGPEERVVERFPDIVEIQHSAPRFTVATKSGAPLFVNVSYQYFDGATQTDSTTFRVRSLFMDGRDTVTALRHTARLTLRTEVLVKKSAEYVLVEVPIPAGCVPDRTRTARDYYEESREVFRDRVAIFCRSLPVGRYVFDVPVEARFRGSFNMNPARAEMMYFPEERGHDVVRRVRID